MFRSGRPRHRSAWTKISVMQADGPFRVYELNEHGQLVSPMPRAKRRPNLTPQIPDKPPHSRPPRTARLLTVRAPDPPPDDDRQPIDSTIPDPVGGSKLSPLYGPEAADAAIAEPRSEWDWKSPQ
jgi:hypothetical protein